MGFPYVSVLAVLSGAAFLIYTIYKNINQNYEHTYGEQEERRNTRAAGPSESRPERRRDVGAAISRERNNTRTRWGHSHEYDRTCTICLEFVPLHGGLSLNPCDHVFHAPCFTQYLATSRSTVPVCPNCRSPMTFNM